MLSLMQASYENVSSGDFYRDLSTKQYLGLLYTKSQELAGFTTFALRELGENKPYDVLFSGDTIIGNSFRGTQELIRGVGRSFGSLLARSQSKDRNLYWLLTTKGHRTFMYLPLFFKEYFPSPDQAAENDYPERLDEICRNLFPELWVPERGLLVHNGDASRLNAMEAGATIQRKKNPYVDFFLKRNPDYHLGTELACIAQISVDNIISFGRKYVQDGMVNPVC